MRTTHFQSMSA